jgi:L-serine dehydratase
VKRISILNDVLGPIMRGPSSSHTAASYQIGLHARDTLGATPVEAEIAFHPGSSYAVCYRRQGSDLGFATGLMGRPIADVRFRHALDDAAASGLDLRFVVTPLEGDDHPNAVRLRMTGHAGERLDLMARSIGGGMFEVTSVNGERSSFRGPAPTGSGRAGAQLFETAAEMVAYAEANGAGAGMAAIAYESELLGTDADMVVAEILRRGDVMARSVEEGLRPEGDPMILLDRTAFHIAQAEVAGRAPFGGAHGRAAYRAMAAMHTNCAMGVVCAAPTAGSAGVLPGVLVTLMERSDATEDRVARSLMAAGMMGVFIAERATFAAEIAGCQVEIGAATAMAAAAAVEFAGGSARQAADAAAISLQNTMGSVCDLVQGVVEIPCHTRNAVGAASALVVADLAMCGYHNPIPLDETIDAVLAVGKMLPEELRVTSRGGIATAPSALALKPRR